MARLAAIYNSSAHRFLQIYSDQSPFPRSNTTTAEIPITALPCVFPNLISLPKMYARGFDYRLPASYLDAHRYGHDRYDVERRYDHHHGSHHGRLRPPLMPRLSSHRRDVYDRVLPSRYETAYAREIDPREQ